MQIFPYSIDIKRQLIDNLRHMSASSNPQITTRLLRAVAKYAMEQGLSGAEIRKLLDVPLIGTSNTNSPLIDSRHVALLLDYCARALDEPFIGLKLGDELDFRSLGTIAYVVTNARKVGDALGNLVRFQNSFTRGFGCFYEQDDDIRVGFTLGHNDDGNRHLSEFCVSAVVSTMKNLIGADWSALRVELEHAKPYNEDSPQSFYQRYFGCDVAFASQRTTLFVSQSVGQQIIPLADTELLSLVERKLGNVSRFQGAGDGLLSDARIEIARALCNRQANIEFIARRLNCSTRTLQRRLRFLGTSFREQLTEVRQALAMEYLQNNDLSLFEVALLLGYSELSAFDHAFDTWFGESPSQVRLRQSETSPSGQSVVTEA